MGAAVGLEVEIVVGLGVDVGVEVGVSVGVGEGVGVCSGVGEGTIIAGELTLMSSYLFNACQT